MSWHKHGIKSAENIYTSKDKKPTVGHKNIYKHSQSGYYVQIGTIFAGRAETIPECVKIRDDRRKLMGLKEAVF